MKKVTKILISLLLLVSIVCSFASCEVLEDVFNFMLNPFTPTFGPGTRAVDMREVRWVESYDEMLEILNKMKNAGTSVPQFIAFDCEEYGIDVKFKISLSKKKDMAKLEPGQSFYDIKLSYVHITCYLFSEDISVAELDKEGVYGPKHYRYQVSKADHSKIIPDFTDVNQLEIIDNADGRWIVYYQGKTQIYLRPGDQGTELTEEEVEILKKTLVVIG